MRAIYLFLVSLCFLLLGGDNHGYAVARHHKTAFSLAKSFESANADVLSTTHHNYPVITTAGTSKEDELVVNVEDEDDNTSFGRKYVLLTKYFFTLAYTLVLSCLYYFFKDKLPLRSQLSYLSAQLYIKQQVFRI